MTGQSKAWTREETAEALNAFFESEEAERYREIYSRDCTAAEDQAVFLRDAERRVQSADESAGRWWASLAALEREQDRLLALAEPLAQHGLLVEELYENLPESFEPCALMQAIAWAIGSPGVYTTGISNTDGWTDEQIRARLEEVRARLDWEGAADQAHLWWTLFETENQQRPGLVLRLAEELAVRKATVTEFHDAYLHSGTENIQAHLHFLDYARLKATAQPGAAEGRRLNSDDSGWWLKPVQGMTKVRGWTDERIRGRLAEAKAKLDWENVAEDARGWWDAFENENAHRLALVLRLAEELVHREATIASFHVAFGLSAVSDVQANLSFLDYRRLKEEEEEKKKAEEERKRRKEAREKNLEERTVAARRRFRELLPLLETDAPAPALSDEDTAILLNLPRQDVPESVRARFEQAIASFACETVLLDETGEIKERRQCQARRFVEELIPGVALEMVEVDGGAFLMGTSEEDAAKEREEIARYTTKENAEKWVNSEMPRRKVSVPSFYIGKFTITQEQWSVVAGWEKVERDLDPDPSNFKGDARPVETITWHDAKEFCARLSKKTGRAYRLPTEAEWEYTCRAGATTPFAFGETITPEIVNYNGEYPYAKAKKGLDRKETVPVGCLGVANAFGLYDMHGNVWEWCEDVWHGNYEGAPTDGSAWLSVGDSSSRLLRGGSWGDQSIYCRSAVRNDYSPGNRNLNIGVRVVVARVS